MRLLSRRDPVHALNGRLARQECAARLDVGSSTVRSQLASIYRKTGTSGQPDMIRMVVSATLV